LIWCCIARIQSEKEKEGNERKLTSNQTQPSYTRHSRKKMTPRWIEWCGKITIKSTKVSHTRCLKAKERLMHWCMWSTCHQIFSLFFIFTKTKMPLVLNNKNKKKPLWNYNQAPKAKAKIFEWKE
jgi:hypothetical protein